MDLDGSTPRRDGPTSISLLHEMRARSSLSPCRSAPAEGGAANGALRAWLTVARLWRIGCPPITSSVCSLYLDLHLGCARRDGPCLSACLIDRPAIRRIPRAAPASRLNGSDPLAGLMRSANSQFFELSESGSRLKSPDSQSIVGTSRQFNNRNPVPFPKSIGGWFTSPFTLPAMPCIRPLLLMI